MQDPPVSWQWTQDVAGVIFSFLDARTLLLGIARTSNEWYNWLRYTDTYSVATHYLRSLVDFRNHDVQGFPHFFIEDHPEITREKRARLLRWLYDVDTQWYRIGIRAWVATAALIDEFLCVYMEWNAAHFQLLGCVAYYCCTTRTTPVDIDELLYLCAGAFTRTDFDTLLEHVRTLAPPKREHMVDSVVLLCGVLYPGNSTVFTEAMYLLRLSVYSYPCQTYTTNQCASCVVACAARRFLKGENLRDVPDFSVYPLHGVLRQPEHVSCP